MPSSPRIPTSTAGSSATFSSGATTAPCTGATSSTRIRSAACIAAKSKAPRHLSPISNNKQVVILGCGFGGLWAAQGLRKAPVEVTVIDRTNHHLFSPLLYQVATAGLSAPSIAAPIRHILADQRNTTVLMGEVKSIDPMGKNVALEDGRSEEHTSELQSPTNLV